MIMPVSTVSLPRMPLAKKITTGNSPLDPILDGEAESTIVAPRNQEVDAIVGEDHAAMVCLGEVEEALRQAEQFTDCGGFVCRVHGCEEPIWMPGGPTVASGSTVSGSV